MDRVDPEVALRMATEIVVAYLGRTTVEPDRLASLVREVRIALGNDVDMRQPSWADQPPAQAAEGNRPQPAVPPEDSVTPEHIISLEDGKPYRSLRRHLMAQYGLTPDQYRAKWNLPADYPMVAPSYAAERSAVAKRIGLGKRSVEGVVEAPKGRKSAARGGPKVGRARSRSASKSAGR